MHVVIIFLYVLQVFFDIVFVIQNKGNHHFPSSCDSAVTYIMMSLECVVR